MLTLAGVIACATPGVASTQSFATASMHRAARASARPAMLDPRALAHARKLRVRIAARYLSLGLRVTEASSTGVLESFTLLSSDLQETRVIPAANGIYYAICARGATCPYPKRRLARPAEDLSSRRLALELALRTLLETSVDVVVVSLPTSTITLLIVERDELVREVKMRDMVEALGTHPARTPTAAQARVVDRTTRPRVYLQLGLEPTPSGRTTLGAMPRWPAQEVLAGRAA
jgi:hypothetical protein